VDRSGVRGAPTRAGRASPFMGPARQVPFGGWPGGLPYGPSLRVDVPEGGSASSSGDPRARCTSRGVPCKPAASGSRRIAQLLLGAATEGGTGPQLGAPRINEKETSAPGIEQRDPGLRPESANPETPGAPRGAPSAPPRRNGTPDPHTMWLSSHGGDRRNAPSGIRTRATTLKGWRPGPLVDGGQVGPE
jgi:hypothetical protein